MNWKNFGLVSTIALMVPYYSIHAAVVTSGTNVFNPLPGGDGFIGIGFDTMAPAAGTLSVDGGSAVDATTVHIGATTGSAGTATLNNGTINTGAADTFNEVKIGDNGTGTLNASNGSQINMTGQPFFAVGRQASSHGSATLDNSSISLTVDSATDWGASVHIGRNGIGSLTLNNGSSLTITDSVGTPGSQSTAGEGIQVGRDGGPGTFTVDASTVNVSGTGASLQIGRGDAVGTLIIRNGSAVDLTSSSDNANDFANIHVGFTGSGNNASLSVEDSVVSLNGMAGGANIFVGSDSTNGVASFSGATTVVTLDSTASTGLVVGRDTSNGVANISDGATININGNIGRLDVGRVGAVGTVNITSGGTINAIGASDGDAFIGAAFTSFGRPDGGVGTVIVDGAGSELNVLDRIIVGAPEASGGGTGTGTLTVRNGGVVNATTINVGTGGTLNGNGTINANVVVDGGTVAPGNSPGTMTINGDFDLLMGRLLVEIAGTGAGQFDVFNVLGNADLSGGIVEFRFQNGFALTTGQTLDFFDATGILNLTGVTYEVSGLEDGFQFDIAQDGGGGLAVEALNDGEALPTPEPATAGLIGAGFLALWSRARLKSRRSA